MITCVYAPPKFGKSLKLAFLFNLFVYDKERTKLAKEKLIERINLGYPLNEYLNYRHFVFSNISFVSRRFGYSPIISNPFNPFEFGLPNKKFTTRFFPEYSVLIVDEAQKYLNSRKKLNEYTSRAYETSGHMHYDLYLATQRPGLIDLNVRELITRFIDIRKAEFITNEFGQVLKTIIHTVEHDNCYAVEKYIESGRVTPSGETKTYEFEGDLRRSYNAFEYAESFYNGFHDKETKFESSNELTREEVVRSDYVVPNGYYEK